MDIFGDIYYDSLNYAAKITHLNKKTFHLEGFFFYEPKMIIQTKQ